MTEGEARAEYLAPWLTLPTEAEARAAYLAQLGRKSRAELLRSCRAGGISAHRCPTDILPGLLWQRFGRPRWLEKQGRNDA